MNETLNESLFDVRTLQRNLVSGRISDDQVQVFLDSLKDCGEEGAWTSTTIAMPSNAAYVEPVPEDE